jgi:hypothetical protein
MVRGSILCAALLGSGSAQPHSPGKCGDCNVDLTALEEFTADYDVVLAHFNTHGYNTAATGTPPITTTALPPMLPSDHGTIAVHARNLQLKLDNHLAIPQNFPNPRQHPIISMLAGHEIHEELHINGVNGQASFHLGSPVFNACIQVDLPPVPINHEMLEEQLGQAQQIATMVVRREGVHVTVDGVPGVGVEVNRGTIFMLTDDSHPEMVLMDIPIRPGEEVGLKFSNYKNSVGDAFSVRACEVEAHTATQTMLAENPDVQDFFAQRLAEHQSRLQALLEPTWLNTRYNFIPLQVADLMLAPSPEGCANNVLAETAPMATNTFQSLALGVCSFVMGVTATYGAMRKKAAPSDSYYHVSA